MLQVYTSDTTDFSTMGLASLHPFSATEKNKINGVYSLDFQIALKHAYEIQKDRIVKTEEGQLYRILVLDKTASDKETVNVYAESLFQIDMLDDFVVSFIHSDVTVQYMLEELLQGTIYSVGTCDNFGLESIALTHKNKSEVLKQILHLFKAELEINGLQISIKNQIGSNNGVEIKKGKNLKNIDETEDISNVVTRLHYTNKNENLGGTLDSPFIENYSRVKNAHVQFDADTQAELDALAQQWLEQNDKPYINYQIDFADLYYTREYAQFKELEKVNLGDVVTIKHDVLGIDIQARILEADKDLIEHRNNKVVLGNFRQSYMDFNVALTTTKSTVEYAFSDRRLNSATLKGLTIVDENRNVNSFVVSEQGEISINANVTLSPDSIIEWDSIEDADYIVTQISNNTIETTNVVAENLKVKSANISGTIQLNQLATITWNDIDQQPFIPDDNYITTITQDTVTTAYVNALEVTAKKVFAEDIDTTNAKITTAQIEELEVGANVTMGANAQISWGQVTGQPTIIDENTVTTITQNEISTATINANQITGNNFSAISGISIGDMSTSFGFLEFANNGGLYSAITLDTNGLFTIFNFDDILINSGGRIDTISSDMDIFSSFEIQIWGGEVVDIIAGNEIILDADTLDLSFIGNIEWGNNKPTAVFG